MGKLLDTFIKMKTNRPIKDRLTTSIESDDNQPDSSQYPEDIQGDQDYHNDYYNDIPEDAMFYHDDIGDR